MGDKITAEEFDRIFDEGEEDVVGYLKLDTLHRPGLDEARRVNISMPAWLIDVLDREARHLAVNRQAIINTWLAEKAEEVIARRVACGKATGKRIA